MAVNSKQKGSRGEREAAEYLRTLGFQARRTQQYCGAAGNSDVVSEPLANLHLEVKRDESIDLGTAALTAAMEQTEGDKKEGTVPVVLWRCNRQQWRLSWRLEGQIVTVCGDEAVKHFLSSLNNKPR